MTDGNVVCQHVSEGAAVAWVLPLGKHVSLTLCQKCVETVCGRVMEHWLELGHPELLAQIRREAGEKL